MIKPCEVCQEVATKRCAKCSGAWYCSKECQVADWKEHKKLCRINNYYADKIWEKDSEMKKLLIEEELNTDMSSQQGDAGEDRSLLKAGIPFQCKVCRRTTPKSCTEWYCVEVLDAEGPFGGGPPLSFTSTPGPPKVTVSQPGSSYMCSSPPLTIGPAKIAQLRVTPNGNTFLKPLMPIQEGLEDSLDDDASIRVYPEKGEVEYTAAESSENILCFGTKLTASLDGECFISHSSPPLLIEPEEITQHIVSGLDSISPSGHTDLTSPTPVQVSLDSQDDETAFRVYPGEVEIEVERLSQETEEKRQKQIDKERLEGIENNKNVPAKQKYYWRLAEEKKIAERKERLKRKERESKEIEDVKTKQETERKQALEKERQRQEAEKQQEEKAEVERIRLEEIAKRQKRSADLAESKVSPNKESIQVPLHLTPFVEEVLRNFEKRVASIVDGPISLMLIGLDGVKAELVSFEERQECWNDRYMKSLGDLNRRVRVDSSYSSHAADGSSFNGKKKETVDDLLEGIIKGNDNPEKEKELKEVTKKPSPGAIPKKKEYGKLKEKPPVRKNGEKQSSEFSPNRPERIGLPSHEELLYVVGKAYNAVPQNRGEKQDTHGLGNPKKSASKRKTNNSPLEREAPKILRVEAPVFSPEVRQRGGPVSVPSLDGVVPPGRCPLCLDRKQNSDHFLVACGDFRRWCQDGKFSYLYKSGRCFACGERGHIARSAECGHYPPQCGKCRRHHQEVIGCFTKECGDFLKGGIPRSSCRQEYPRNSTQPYLSKPAAVPVRSLSQSPRVALPGSGLQKLIGRTHDSGLPAWNLPGSVEWADGKFPPSPYLTRMGILKIEEVQHAPQCGRLVS